jgi:hypothetical protein
VIVYQYKPNLDRTFRAIHFRTNSRGFRDGEYPFDKPPGIRRVAVIGSSFALPAGVEIEDAFHSLLERRLTAEFPATSYEFLNFAVGAHGPSQMIAILLRRALAYDPDLILFSLTGLAAPPMLGPWDRERPAKMLDALAPRGLRSLFVRLLRTRIGLEKPHMPEAKFAFPRGTPPRENAIWKLGEIQRETGIPIVIVRLEIDPAAPSPLERELEKRAVAKGLLGS